MGLGGQACSLGCHPHCFFTPLAVSLLPSASVNSGAFPDTVPISCIISFLLQTTFHSKCAGHHGAAAGSSHTQSRLTRTPTSSWSVLERLIHSPAWRRAPCLWHTSSTFSAVSSETLSRNQIPTARGSNWWACGEGIGMGCLPRAGPTPRLLILMASCCALCSGWVTAYRLRCLVIAELRYSSADLYPRALRHATPPGPFPDSTA